MESRFDAVCRKAGELMKGGLVIYSPIAHCHPIAVRTGLPRDWSFWQKLDHDMIRGASAVWVLQLPGWETSKGVAAEIGIATELGIPVVPILP